MVQWILRESASLNYCTTSLATSEENWLWAQQGSVLCTSYEITWALTWSGVLGYHILLSKSHKQLFPLYYYYYYYYYFFFAKFKTWVRHLTKCSRWTLLDRKSIRLCHLSVAEKELTVLSNRIISICCGAGENCSIHHADENNLQLPYAQEIK